MEKNSIVTQNIEYIELKNSKFTYDKNSTLISITSYNILADYYVQMLEGKEKYLVSTDSEYIKIENRSKIVVETIKKIDSDIVFLQEVDKFEEHYKKQFEQLGYNFLFCKKNKEAGDASVILFKTNKFDFLNSENIDLNLNHPLEDTLEYKKGIIAVCAELIHKESKKKIITLSTHLTHDPREEHIKYLQICQLNYYLSKNYTKEDIIFWGGDLNSLEKDNNIQFALRGSKPLANLIDFYSDKILEEELKIYDYYSKFEHTLKWSNLYALYGVAVGKNFTLPKYTNYAINFKGTIDHILYNTDKATPIKILKIDEEEIEKNKSIPSKQFPSDHVPISGIFMI